MEENNREHPPFAYIPFSLHHMHERDFYTANEPVYTGFNVLDNCVNHSASFSSMFSTYLGRSPPDTWSFHLTAVDLRTLGGVAKGN